MADGYTGSVVRIALGKEGLAFSKNPSNIPPSGLLQAEAISYSDDSVHLMPGISKLGGYSGASFTFASTDVTPGTDTITHTAHGLVTGDGPIHLSNPATLPVGLFSTLDYWVIRTGADTFKLATSYANAIAGTAVDITGAGSGTTTVAARRIVAVYDWFPTEGQQSIVTLSDYISAYIVPSATATQLGQNPSPVIGSAAPPSAIFVPAGGEMNGSGRMLVAFTGNGQPKVVRGGSLTFGPFSNGPTDWTSPTGGSPVTGAVHNGRLFTFGVAGAPHSLYGSTIDDHQDFKTGVETGVATASSATYDRIHPGIGQRLYYGISHKGMLFLLKYPNGIFYLDDTDVNPEGWRADIVTDSTGCIPSPYAGVLVDDGILFMSPSAQFFLITATTQGGIVVTDLSTRMNLDQWLGSHVNITRLGQVQSVWDPTLKIAHFAVPSQRDGTNSTTNDLLLSFDFRSFTKGDAKVRFSYSYRDAVGALGLRRNPTTFIYEPMFADYVGNLWRMGDDDRSINSALPGATPVTTGYVGVFQTNHTDIVEYSDYRSTDTSLGTMNKVWDWIGIEYVPNIGGSITVTQYNDGVAQPAQTVDLVQAGPRLAPSTGNTEFTIYSGSGSTVASELAGTSTAGLDLRVKWLRAVGTSRRISIQVASSGVASEDMNITALYLGYRKAGQDVGRGQGSS